MSPFSRMRMECRGTKTRWGRNRPRELSRKLSTLKIRFRLYQQYAVRNLTPSFSLNLSASNSHISNSDDTRRLHESTQKWRREGRRQQKLLPGPRIIQLLLWHQRDGEIHPNLLGKPEQIFAAQNRRYARQEPREETSRCCECFYYLRRLLTGFDLRQSHTELTQFNFRRRKRKW